jgi:hypothetical protein
MVQEQYINEKFAKKSESKWIKTSKCTRGGVILEGTSNELASCSTEKC